MVERWREWWSTAQSSVTFHRWAKWVWVFPGIPISFLLREQIAYLTFLSVYAIITGHWSSEEAALSAVLPDDRDMGEAILAIEAKLDALLAALDDS